MTISFRNRDNPELIRLPYVEILKIKENNSGSDSESESGAASPQPNNRKKEDMTGESISANVTDNDRSKLKKKNDSNNDVGSEHEVKPQDVMNLNRMIRHSQMLEKINYEKIQEQAKSKESPNLSLQNPFKSSKESVPISDENMQDFEKVVCKVFNSLISAESEQTSDLMPAPIKNIDVSNLDIPTLQRFAEKLQQLQLKT